MLVRALLVAHIAVLGYWLGAELVINSTYRYVAFGSGMPFAERGRLMEHVMDVDQHVRYGLALQAALGTALAALYGYVPGGMATGAVAGALGAAWLGFIEIVHWRRNRPDGRRLAAIDRAMRYVLLVLVLAIAAGMVGGGWPLPGWLRWKLACFAGVIACGVGIRLALMEHFRTWERMKQNGVSDETNAIIRRTYLRSTAVLVLLWVFIGAMVVASVWKPA
jgi:hypothetical protein